MISAKKGLFVSVIALVVVGCSADDPYLRTKSGAAIGAVAGAVLGHQIDHDSGRYVGAAVGALAGGAVGNYMDNQQQEFEETLSSERSQNQLEIERLKDDTLKLSLDSEISFDLNSANIKPAFERSLNKLAGVIVKYDRTTVRVVGHTDSTGSWEYNKRLSERRADSVARYLEREGVPAVRLTTEGRGPDEPRATNSTAAGRQLNRRVEIYIKPVVEE